ncbi:MAG: hypothetical protein A2X22_00485 [Bacteroidetes bacterium GWF2_49_14]|nr:MAG: hypothetical protein A2X22_00485 [Bacteroidetes bacterium GWF2_49_14]
MRSDLFYKSMEQMVAMEKSGYKSGQQTWQQVGPTNIGGRITDVEMPSNDQNMIYVAAASGGIFKSTNFGTNWTPIFEDAVSLSIGDMDIARTNSSILWVGTGEPNAGGGSHTYEGYGVYKSTDAGATWTQSGLTNVGSIGRVKIHPAHPDTVFVAAMGHLFADNSERGVFRTTDSGATWEKVLYLSDSTGAVDLAINPQNGNVIYAALWERSRRPDYQNYCGNTSGIWRSTDAGTTWIELTEGLPNGQRVGRIGIDLCDANPDVLYAVYSDSISFAGTYKSTNGGDTWAKTVGTANESSSYNWWFSEIDVDPINPNIAYLSGFLTFKTTNGGNTWTGNFTNAHVDMHGVFVHPAQNGLTALCSDGGLYLSRNGGTTNFMIENLPITQFYTCEVDYMNPTRYYGGTQDNGTNRVTNGQINRWESIYGGDGFVVKVDPTDNNYIYAESQYGGLGRSTDGGNSFMGAKTGIVNNDRFNWKTPIELDPQNPATMYVGTQRLYKSTNRAATWQPISTDLTNGPGQMPASIKFGTITTISVSPLDSKIIYVGTDDGNVWNTTTPAIGWNNLSANLPDRWITCVQTDPFDKAVAYVTLSGYRWDAYLPHVYRTADNGATWADISGNLPDFPVNNIQIDPVLRNTYYLATDGGVFITINSGQTWELYGQGLPHVVVNELCFHNPTRMLTAATFGRSMFTIPLPSSSSSVSIPLSSTEIKAWPNPFQSDLNIGIRFSQPENGEIAVWDLAGRKISVLFKGTLEPGDQTIRWKDSGQVPSGTYIIRLQTDKTSGSVRIQKQ